MKQTFFSAILTTVIALAANAQIVNIPDSAFKAYLIGRSDINTNGDNEIQLSEAQAFSGAILPGQNDEIADLTGLEAFTALTHLSVGSNQLTSVDVSNNTELLILGVVNTSLTSIDVSNNPALTDLNLSYNQLTNVDVSNNPALMKLYLNNNQLTSVDVSNNPALTYIDCFENQLTSIDVSNNPELTYLVCHNNQLTSLNVANGNNINFTHCAAAYNPNLFCIQVDDAVWSEDNWRNVNGFLFDTTQYFYDNSNSCPYVAPTSITEALVNNKFAVYPNPTNGIAYFSESINIQVTNSIGQIVINKKNVNSFDLSEQPTGMYFIIFTNDKGQVVQRNKIVKE